MSTAIKSAVYCGLLYDFKRQGNNGLWTCRVDPVTYFTITKTCPKAIKNCKRAQSIVLKIQLEITPPDFIYSFKLSGNYFEYIELVSGNIPKILQSIVVNGLRIISNHTATFWPLLNSAWDLADTSLCGISASTYNQLRQLDNIHQQLVSIKFITRRAMIQSLDTTNVDALIKIIQDITESLLRSYTLCEDGLMQLEQIIEQFKQ